MFHRHLKVFSLAAISAVAVPAAAITIEFDYTYDTSGFFSDPQRKTLLASAAQSFNGFADPLSAITPSGSNTWAAQFLNPSTGAPTSLPDLSIPYRTVRFFVGARDLGPGTPAAGVPGGVAAAGDPAFVNTVAFRGQTGATLDPATSTDFGPWGGSITFNSSITNWHVGPVGQGITPDKIDFYSVAVHELAHALGFGSAPSFQRHVSGTQFTGPAATAEHGSAVPLHTDLLHWAEGTTGRYFIPYDPTHPVYPAAMNPTLPLGTYRYFTTLDRAAMQDIGWETANIVKGDVNDDGVVNAGDINPFIYALSTTEEQFLLQYPNGIYWNADVNYHPRSVQQTGDGYVNSADLIPFITIGSGGFAGLSGPGALHSDLLDPADGTSAAMSEVGWEMFRIPGDVNNDGTVNAGDINPFIYALSSTEEQFLLRYPDGKYWNGDVNGPGKVGDGYVNSADIMPFFIITSGGGEPALHLQALNIPEPAMLAVHAPLLMVFLRRRRCSRTLKRCRS